MGKLRISDGIDVHYGSITAKGGIDGLDLSNGISGSNFNISGVNALTINDPGEGIIFGGGSTTVTLYAIDDSTDSIMNFSNASELRVNNNKVWTVSNDGASSGLDADLLDGQHGSHYLDYNNFTNTPTIPSLSGYATESYVNTQVSNLVDSAPGTLNTLNELAAALGDDASFSTTVTNSIATKLPLAGGTLTGTLNVSATTNARDIKISSGYHLMRSNHHSGHLEGSYNNVGDNGSKSNPIYTIGSSYNPTDAALSNMYGIGFCHSNASFISFTGASGWGLYVASDGDARIFLGGGNGVISSTGEHYVGSSRVFHDTYHPNADKWTTARTLSLTGAVTGSVSWDGSGNASISTTATSDPTLTLSGDASGSATFTNLGNATLSVTIADDSHNHVISNVDGLQTALDGKLTSSSGLNASNLTSGTVPSDRLATGASGDWWSGNVVKVGTDGVSEVGKYLDFHNTDAGTSDFDTRLYSSGSSELTINGSGRIFTDGYHPNADKWTTARTLSLTGDVTGSVSWDGSGNASITTVVGNDSHNHNHSDGNFTVNGVLQAGAGSNHISTSAAPFRWQRSSSGQTGQDDNVSVYVDDSNIYFTHNNDADGDASGYLFRYMTGGTATNLLVFSSSTMTYKGQTVFHTGYHPNADTWTTARTITLGGDLSGSVSINGSTNVTLTATIADDSHNHIISNVDGLQTALDAKLASSSYTASDVLTKIKTVDGSGSGLDADLLDGQHGSYYAPTANPTFSGTVTGTQFKWNVDGSGHNYLGTDIYDALVLHSRPGETIYYGSGETSSSVKAHRFMSSTTNNTTGLGNEVFSITAGGSAALSGTSFTAGGNTVWHAGNDGSGSGLDADKIDGIDIDASSTGGAIAYSSSSTQISATTQQKVHQGTYGQRMVFTMGGPSGSAQNFGNIGDNSSVVGGYSDDFTISAGADLVLGQGGYARVRFDGSTAHFFNPIKLGNTVQDSSGNTRISSSGRMYPLDVSVGSSPSKNMEYASSTLTVGSVDDDDFYLNLKGFGGNSNIQLDDGDIWVNGTSNSTAAYKFASNGHFHSNGDVIAYSSTLTASDKRLKENIVPLDSSLDKINKLQGVKYDWKNKDKGTNQLGLIAQEVEKVVPEVVKEVKDGLGDISGMKVVNYTALVPVLIEAIKEQQKELEYMKAEIKTLKGEK